MLFRSWVQTNNVNFKVNIALWKNISKWMPCKISEIDLRKRYMIEIQVLNCERRNCGLLNYKEFSASYTQTLRSSIRRGKLSEEIRRNHWQTKAKFIRPLFPSSSSSGTSPRRPWHRWRVVTRWPSRSLVVRVTPARCTSQHCPPPPQNKTLTSPRCEVIITLLYKL
jgi:hypothetical protein